MLARACQMASCKTDFVCTVVELASSLFCSAVLYRQLPLRQNLELMGVAAQHAMTLT